MAAEQYLATNLAPSILTPLEPSAAPVIVGIDWGVPGGASTVTGTYNPATGQVTDIRTIPDAPSDAVQRILRATSDACARWFKVVRAAISRERDRQQKFRVEHGLPKSARLPYQKPLIERSECSTWQAAESTLRCLYGDDVADYARTKFLRAIETGDMRAFKIRLLVIKARDSLTGTPLLPDFIAGIEDCISTAEEIAGCIPDNSPRRLSRKEQERKKLILAQREKKAQQQPELNLTWSQEKNDTIQDIVHKHDVNPADGIEQSVLDEPCQKGSKSSFEINKPKNDEFNNEIDSKSSKSVGNENIKKSSVTVTVQKSVTVTPKMKRHRKKKVIRKLRAYQTVDEIINDIEAGQIVPYLSVEEICADIKSGVLTEAEALMFTCALDRYSPELENKQIHGLGVNVEDDIGEDPEDTEDELEDENENFHHEERRTSYSYNPRGFGGLLDFEPEDE